MLEPEEASELIYLAGHGAKHRVVDLDIDIGADAVDYK